MQTVPSMPSRIPRLVLGALLAAGVAACDGSRSAYRSPTAPESPAAPLPPSPPAPPAADLTGTWTGTRYVTFDEIDGGGGCESPTTAVLEQHGARVLGTVSALAGGCGSSQENRLEGVLEGTQLRFRYPDIGWGGFGEVTGDQLILAAFNVRWVLRQ